jgi:hypothetical protein
MSECEQCKGRGWYYVPARKAERMAYELVPDLGPLEPLVPLSFKLQCPKCSGKGTVQPT